MERFDNWVSDNKPPVSAWIASGIQLPRNTSSCPDDSAWNTIGPDSVFTACL